jgi:4'-phosphopantetheinyl transferase
MFAPVRATEASRVARTGPQVWRVRIASSPHVYETALRTLDEHERLRAARFRQDADRMRYVLGRASLRRLLSMQLDVPNERLAFGANSFGKPVLLEPLPGLHFNSSHSGEWILHAFDALGPVGIDVEAARPDFAHVDDFAAAFSPEERSELAGVPEQGRAVALARAWVRKEAYVKAIGQGVSRSLLSIRIDAAATGRPCLIYDRNDDAPSRWSFEDIPVDARHVACLVYREAEGESGRERRLVVNDFEERQRMS